jgi:hypothetical protein
VDAWAVTAALGPGAVQHNGRTFDWLSKHDPQSRDYAIREAVRPVPRNTSRFWTPGPVLDQGSEGACVGMGCAGEASASPNRIRGVDFAYAFGWYKRAQQIDGQPGEAYSGTSVLAGMKVGVERGVWDGYRWAFGIQDVVQALLQLGPVVIGIDWYDSMYETKPDGEVVVSGNLVGGHCILLTGYSPSYGRLGETIRWRNSWGPSYGKNGNGYIRSGQLAELLQQNGEAAIPVGRHLLPKAA